jgi:hypothetical protein
MNSVFVIYKSTSDGGVAIGYVHNETKAQEIVKEHEVEMNKYDNAYDEYKKNSESNQRIIDKHIRENAINIERMESEYDELKKKPKPDTSKVPVERQATVLANWFKKYGNRIQELEKYLSMSVLDVKEHNKKVIKDAHALVPSLPELKEPADYGSEYYYEEVEEMIFH